MPGITGIITRTFKNEHKQTIQEMTRSILHESFYNSGVYNSSEPVIHIGWTSHKDSFSDHMPVYNRSKDLLLFFTGESFHHSSTDTKGIETTHASYLMHLYEEQKETFFTRLNGFFAGVLIDLKARTVILFNDRYGVKRLYYHQDKDEFIFSTEAKTLLKIKPELRVIDKSALGEFAGFGCVLNNNTLFPGISIMPGGSKWTFAKGLALKKESYFTPGEWEQQPAVNKKDYYRELRQTFIDIIPPYLQPSGKIAMSLTGGIDTRIIMAYAFRTIKKIDCYTFGGIFRDCFDVKISRKIARACGQKHNTLRMDSSFLKNLPQLVESSIYLTDGNIDMNGAPMLYMNKRAREIAPIRITGNYGSEVIRKLSIFNYHPPSFSIFSEDFVPEIKQAKYTFQELKAGNRLSFIAFKQAPWHHYGAYALEDSQLTLRSPYMDNALIKLLYREPRSFGALDVLMRLISDGTGAFDHIPTDRGIGGGWPFPFSTLRHLYYEFLFKMDYYFNYGMPQWLAKLNYVLQPLHMENLFLGHHKYTHFRVFFRDSMAQYLRDILLSNKTLNRDIWNKKTIKMMVRNHTQGYKNYTNEINKVLTIELIHRLLIENM
jgi:asparagine synthase (glutamine-hydrolysing)